MSSRKIEEFITQKSHELVQNALLEADRLRHPQNYFGMKDSLIKTLRNRGMNVNIHFFGSRFIGLAHKESDMDIYIEYGNNYYSDKNVDRDRQVLEQIVNIIENSGQWRVTNKILTAAVPILQVVYTPNNIKCDISVSNGLGVANSTVIAYLFDLQPEAKKFYHFMKIFLQRYERYFEGYLLKLLVIFYLQNENIFPSIKMIQDNIPVQYISGWPTVEINKSRTVSYYRLNQMINYKTYIPKFFQFYSKFEYSTFVMSIYDGKKLNRFNYEYPGDFKGSILCIFGPLNRKHNIGKYPSKTDVEHFINICKIFDK